MKKIDFAIERGFRLFENEINFFHFYMIQIKIEKAQIKDKNYEFQLFNENSEIVYSRRIIIDKEKNRIITPFSHEDPLVSDNKNYMICFQLWDSAFYNIKGNHFLVKFKEGDNLILAEPIVFDLKALFKQPDEKISQIEDTYFIKSNEGCIFRFHLGDENGNYSEKEFKLNADQKISFKEYLQFPYLGLQCSYENKSPELEEKHIVIGQKGMTLSGDYLSKNKKIYSPLLPFKKEYKTLYIENDDKLENISRLENFKKDYAIIKEDHWHEINSIESLLDFNQEKTIHFYEIDANFIENQYKLKNTYGLNKTYTTKESKKHHIDLELCQTCQFRSLCMELVPSGLSHDLFKENIFKDEQNECRIYQLIKNKKIITV